jgi:hypothetical protein
MGEFVMKNPKLKSVMSGLTMMLVAACAKHAIPNYYDANGTKIPFSEYKAMAKCDPDRAKHGFNVNRENELTLNKYGKSKHYSIRTVYVSDVETLKNPNAAIKNGAPTPEAVANVAAIKQQDDFISKYPVEHGVAENQNTPENITVNLNCEELQADYMGPGTTTGISGAIKDNSLNSIEINGTDSSLGKPQQVDVTIERLIPDGTVKGQKKAWVLAKDRDSNGLYSFKITLVKTSAVGTRTIVFTQDVVDDVTTKVTIDKALAQEYRQALDPTSASSANLKSELDKSKGKTIDFDDVAELIGYRDAIVSCRKAGACLADDGLDPVVVSAKAKKWDEPAATQTADAAPATAAVTPAVGAPTTTAPTAATPSVPAPTAAAPTVPAASAAVIAPTATAADAAPNPNAAAVNAAPAVTTAPAATSSGSQAPASEAKPAAAPATPAGAPSTAAPAANPPVTPADGTHAKLDPPPFDVLPDAAQKTAG